MITVYKITNDINNKIYFGITKTKLNLRWNSHVFSSQRKNTPLYAAMRKYGQEKFHIIPIVYCGTWDYACIIEKALIASHDNLYNLADGGQGGFNIKDVEDWKAKLRLARKGRKPFLGGKHSEETKRICGEAARAYHSRVRSNEPN